MVDGFGCAAPRDRSVWLLGNAHPCADQSIGWDDDPFPNLSDPDALIVDLTTLTKPVLDRVGSAKLEQAQPFILDKILNRGTVVVITRPFLMAGYDGDTDEDASRPIPDHCLDSPKICSNYQIFPTRLATKKVPEGKVIVVDPEHDFKDYMDTVSQFSFYIERYSPDVILKIDSRRSIMLQEVEGQKIMDNSGHNLGLTLTANAVGIDRSYYSLENSGRLIFLPPPTGPTDNAIEKILLAYGKVNSHAELLPAWAESLSLGQASAYLQEIKELKEEKFKIEEVIGRLQDQCGKILTHRRLLYSNGPELEDAIVEAFMALGFDDVERMGKGDEEDASFGMGGNGAAARYSRCVIEAKGSGKGTKMQDILQCSRWAAQRAAADGRPAKGVFVPNQHRLSPYPESREIRTKIETNQQEQAELDDICIIPSCVLFEAVRRVLDGAKPNRAGIAAKIAATKGVLTDVL